MDYVYQKYKKGTELSYDYGYEFDKDDFGITLVNVDLNIASVL